MVCSKALLTPSVVVAGAQHLMMSCLIKGTVPTVELFLSLLISLHHQPSLFIKCGALRMIYFRDWSLIEIRYNVG